MNNLLQQTHHTLIYKINLYTDLEKEIIQSFKRQYGDTLENIIRKNVDNGQTPSINIDFKSTHDKYDVYQVLKKNKNLLENREIKILSCLFKIYKKNAIELAYSVYEQHGIKWGKKYHFNKAQDIYVVLNNHIANEIPFHNTKRITEINDNYLEYKQECPNMYIWKKIGIHPSIMFNIRRTWIETFVNSVNPEFKYQVTTENMNGKIGYFHKIFKK